MADGAWTLLQKHDYKKGYAAAELINGSYLEALKLIEDPALRADIFNMALQIQLLKAEEEMARGALIGDFLERLKSGNVTPEELLSVIISVVPQDKLSTKIRDLLKD